MKSPSTCQQSKQTSEGRIIAADPVTIRGSSSSKCLTEKFVPTVSKSPLISKREAKSTVDTKISTAHQVSVESRPSSAPPVPGLRPATPLISTAPAVPLLSRSVSAVGRLGVDPQHTVMCTRQVANYLDENAFYISSEYDNLQSQERGFL